MHILADLPQALPRFLTRALSEGGGGNFLVVSIGPVYLQFAVSPDRAQLLQEAVGNSHLPRDRQLGAAPLAELAHLGFDTAAAGNPSRCLSVGRSADLDRIAAETSEILRHVYGCDDSDRVDVELELEDIEHPENPRLVAALGALADDESVEMRRELLRALLASVLLVPVEKPSEAFTDYAALLAAYPDGVSYAPHAGIELFPQLAGCGDPALRLNPAGPMGLQISRDYLQALARASVELRHSR